MTDKAGLPDPVYITQANWLDFMALNRLSKVCFGRDAWPWIDMLAALMAPRAIPLKAAVFDQPSEQEQLVGYVIADHRRPDLGWIASIGVHPDWREFGIGNALLEQAEQRLATPVVRLTLRRSNQKALRLYLKRGYQQLKVWPSYYHDGEDGLIMERIMLRDETD